MVTGADVHVMIQNIYMYMDSIVCGLIVLFSQDPSKVFTVEVRITLYSKFTI